MPTSAQAGEQLHAHDDLDRALVRRRDPVWARPEVAAWPDRETFACLSAVPPAAQWNQSTLPWRREDAVLDRPPRLDPERAAVGRRR